MSEEIRHHIKAYLHKNKLDHVKADSLIARVHSERSLSIHQISMSAAGRGGANISPSSMTYAVELWLREMGYQLCDGFSVNTPYFTASPQIKGVFEDEEDRFDRERHSLLCAFRQGTLLRKNLETVKVDVLGKPRNVLSILQVEDVKAQSVNHFITPRGVFHILGERLKVAGEDPRNGVYFTNIQTGVETKTDSLDIAKNLLKRITLIVPPLEPGEYRLGITTQYGGNSKTFLQEPRSAMFERILRVEAKGSSGGQVDVHLPDQ